MHPDKLPDVLHPARFAKARLDIAGSFPQSRLLRLAELVGLQSDVDVELSFAETHFNRISVLGQLRCTVRLTCQRCLDEFDYILDAQVKLLVTTDEKDLAQAESEDFEALQVDADGSVTTVRLIEDELIVRLPIFPAHETLAACNADMLVRLRADLSTEPAVDKPVGSRPNPFAVLQSLKSPSEK
ncbi:MAG: DUF177 domain-containing protein [Gammaproteobacteria bacterium]|nr:DUF177 domain-containing protein [Gammaproteobacteria bacterium]